LDAERINAMRHQTIVFHDVVKRVPWDVFERLVSEHGADKHVRRLTTRGQFCALLYGQLAGASGLREITGGLESHKARLYHAGMQPVKRSTLADANVRRPAAVFAGLFAAMVARAQRGLRRKVAEATYLIDAPSLPIGGRGSEWAHYASKPCGVKAHVIYDADAACPIYASITPARVNDITAAKAMPIEPGATYVFDLAYYDFGWWAQLDAAGCRIVTRFKSHTPLAVTAELEVPDAGNILSDRIGLLPQRQARNRRNPFADPVREVTVKCDTGKVLRILCNDLDAPAHEIAALYKRRWAIELFFRWVKQTLRIRHLIGTSENAVRLQIAVALIAYLLLHLAYAAQAAVSGTQAFARLVRANLMHRKRIDRLIGPDPTPSDNPNQMAWQW
jgi:transposase